VFAAAEPLRDSDRTHGTHPIVRVAPSLPARSRERARRTSTYGYFGAISSQGPTSRSILIVCEPVGSLPRS
jgi:hypothetical protein